MKIYIPTLGRPDRQITYNYLPDEWKQKTEFVISWEEEGFGQYPNLKTPSGIKGIAATRQYIVESCGSKKVFMLDDDLHFHHRENGKLVVSSPKEVGEALKLMEEWLEEIPCVGFSSRFGNNWIKGDYVECSRPCMAYGLDTSIMKKNNIRFDDLEVCEDYHVVLSLLKLGHKNRMIATHTVTSPSVNKHGGCSSYRTKEMVERNMDRFIELHKPYASLRNTKSDTQGFEIGKELRINWKRCYDDATALRKLK